MSAVSNMYDTINLQFHVIMYPVCNANGRAVLKKYAEFLVSGIYKLIKT